MKRNYEEMKSKVEKVMQECMILLKKEINFFQKGLTNLIIKNQPNQVK
jgi:hypothetical protein